MLASQIPQSSAVNKAHLAGKPIFEYAGKSPGALAYDQLGDELLPLLGLPVRLEKAEVGDTVVVTYSEAMIVSLEKVQ